MAPLCIRAVLDQRGDTFAANLPTVQTWRLHWLPGSLGSMGKAFLRAASAAAVAVPAYGVLEALIIAAHCVASIIHQFAAAVRPLIVRPSPGPDALPSR